jgi:5-methylcytosine-specific restriction enzyme A
MADHVQKPRVPIWRQHWRRWYSCAEWKRRHDHQLRKEPFCRKCGSIGTVADHIVHHRAVWHEFLTGELQTLCRPCHETTKKTVENRGFDTAIGLDGYPLDPKHPFVRADPSHTSREHRPNYRFVPPLDDDDDREFFN